MIPIPKQIIQIIETFKKSKFEIYIVGGCVRDILKETQPKDWDITTNAKPAEIQKIFPNSFYKNKFLTVTIKNPDQNLALKEIEITTYRKEAKYTDKRHPDNVEFAKTLQEDLKRRDFTVNAMAIDCQKAKDKEQNNQFICRLPIANCRLIDFFNGQKDLKNEIIKTVGNPEERFTEDALRLIRAVRFATTLGDNWKIEDETLKAIQKNAGWLQAISKERIRDELIKILKSNNAYKGFLLLHKTNLLKYIIPELEKGVGVSQNRHHIYTIFQHSLFSLKYAAFYDYNLSVRLAALFHDIAKPQTKRGKGSDATFYNHDIVGSKFAIRILSRLRFPKKITEKVGLLIRCHMFFYDPETVTESSVRRLLQKVGKENIKELIQLRICDRKGSGVPKAKPYRLRHFEYVISKVSHDPISVKMLKINGNNVIKLLNEQPGPKIGLILNALLSEVLDDPKKNQKAYLEKRVKELGKLSQEMLKKKEKRVKEKKMEIETEEKKKFHVQ